VNAIPTLGSPGRQDDLSTPYLRMGEPEAERLALERYAVEGAATRLETEKDDTFRLDCVDGRRLILKVANPAELQVELELQISLLTYVSDRDAGLPVPDVVPDLDGERLPRIIDDAGQPRMARMLTFIPGLPLDRVRTSRPQRLGVGRLLGRLRLAMEGFDHPGAGRVLAWDVQHLLRLADLLPMIPDDARRADLRRGLERFATLSPRLETLRRQVLHNDFSKSNLIADSDDLDRVVGVIDFGDAVRTAVVIDVSTALLNQLPRTVRAGREEDIFSEGRDVLAGYLEVADLTRGELELLPHLVMSRVVARALITHHRASLFPENARYIMRNTEPGWGQLAWFLSRTEAEVSATFADVVTP
jgi:Ser/Thr protein kinase RdoA (MazF antagonist)